MRQFVEAARLARRHTRDAPRTGCVLRIAPLFTWREQAVIRWRVISIVSSCHIVKLCALAAQAIQSKLQSALRAEPPIGRVTFNSFLSELLDQTNLTNWPFTSDQPLRFLWYCHRPFCHEQGHVTHKNLMRAFLDFYAQPGPDLPTGYIGLSLKLYAHGLCPLRFLGACVWFRDVTSFSDASGMVCVRVEPVSILTHQTHCPGFRKERWRRHCLSALYWGKEKDAERPQNNC